MNAPQQHEDVEDLTACLKPTYYLDAEHPTVGALAQDAIGAAVDDVDKAVRLYYAVRDGFLYDPYSVQSQPETYKASAVIARGRGYCVAKAVVLAAAARAAGIPARLGFADVRNHLATERLRRM